MGLRGAAGRWLKHNCPSVYKKSKFLWPMRKLRRRILSDIEQHPERYDSPELSQAADYLRCSGVSVFPHAFSEKYGSLPVEVRVDGGMAYVVHNGRRLYFPFAEEPGKVVRIYRSLIEEQDPESPHCYRAGGFDIAKGDVLFDIGAAEGIFSLDNIEKVSRVLLFECDPVWTEALKKTFEPWKDKVEIIDKYVSDSDGGDTVRVDTVVKKYGIEAPVFLKMDVEGAEEDVLKGAAETLSRKGTKAVVCTYHRQRDHALLSGMMASRGFNVETSPGYMLFLPDRKNLESPFFRRGVIYCSK